jgi:hypothetical protein
MSARNPAAGARQLLQRGISLVELMVGITVGLIVLAAATTIVTTQLVSTRQLLLETQLDQDLRAASEIVARELRRSMGTTEEGGAQWFSAEQLGVDSNPNRLAVIRGGGSEIEISYRRGPGEDSAGFKLADDAIKMMVSDSTWHEVTDPQVVKVTRFQIGTARAGNRERTLNNAERIVPCPFLCADGTTDCWPRMAPVEYTLTIEGELRRNPAMKRTLQTSVFVRSALVLFPEDLSRPSNVRSCPVVPN